MKSGNGASGDAHGGPHGGGDDGEDLFLPLGGGGHRLRLTNLGLVSFQLGPIPPHIDFDQLSWALVVPLNY